MLTKISNSVFIGLLAFMLVVSFSTAQSQTIWLNQKQQISLEVLKPDLDGPDNTTFITSTVFLSVRLPISERLHFIGELPFVHGELDFAGQKGHDNLGNPYLGLELRRPHTPMFVELGVRPPVANSSFATDFIGFFSDVDRLEAFAVDNFAFLGAINYQPTDYNLLKYRIRVGTSALLQTEGGTDPDIFILFSGQLGYVTESMEALAGITGRSRLTKDRQLGQRTFLQLGAGANFKFGHLRPGLHFTLPIEADLLEIVDFVFGLNLGVEI